MNKKRKIIAGIIILICLAVAVTVIIKKGLNSIDRMDGPSFYSYITELRASKSSEDIITIVDEWIDLNPDDYIGYLTKGIILYESAYYYESIEPLEKAVELSPERSNNENLFYAYFYSDRYHKALDFANGGIGQFENAFGNIQLFTAHIHASFNDYEKANEVLEELLLTAVEYEGRVKIDLAYNYLMLGNDEKAIEYLDSYKKNDTETDKHFTLLKSTIKENSKDDVSYIKDIFTKHYMYDVNYETLDGLSGDLTDEEAYELLKATKSPDDKFTFLLYGDNYNSLEKSELALDYKDLGSDVHYVKINSFTKTVDYEFIRTIDEISNPENSTLIIDLRDNVGGMIMPAVRILDNLIGLEVVCSTKNEKNDNHFYESNPSKIDFKTIYVLVNNKSASSSEVLALSLDTYLDNVILVGEQTFGKGIGQSILDDVKNKRKYFIVNFKWYVGDTNIHEVGITPEVYIENDEIDAYMMELLNLDDF